ncbi:MAG: hypothetical protein ACQESJ_04440 [Bacteroidota bacterium]
MITWIKKIFLTVSLLGVFIMGFSQEGVLTLKGAVEKGEEPLNDAQITLYQDSEEVENIRTGNDGEFSVDMEINKEYTVEFSKDEYVSKKIFVDANVPEDEEGTWMVEFSVGLFKMYPDLDVSALDKPITKILYNERENGFAYDYNYTEKMMAKVDKILQQLEDLKEEAYREIIRKGDDSFDDEEYKEAIKYFEEALDQRPRDRYPKKRLKASRKQLEKKQEQQELYDQAITKADNLFEQEEYKKARDTYSEAIGYNSEKDYPRKQIEKIDDILSDLQAQKQEQQKKNRKYNAYIKTADDQFDNEKYSKAKSNYQKALNIFSEKEYPQQQIDEIDKLLAKQQQKEEENQRYEELLTEADDLFDQEKYIQSKSKYNEALQVKPGESYPGNQVDKIDQILAEKEQKEKKYANLIDDGDKAFQEENYQDAKNDYVSARELKPQENYPQQQIDKIDKILDERKAEQEKYEKNIEKADEAFQAENYNDAKSLYSEALFIKPKEQYPKDQINKIDQILSQRQAKEENYENTIEQADNYFEEENYKLAKDSYQEALSIKSSEQYPEDQISKIDKILEKEAQKAEEYKNLIAEADKAFDDEDYTSSKKKYQQALDIKSDEKYPKQRIDKIDQILADLAEEREEKAKYDNAIKEADTEFDEENYSDAKELYSEALFIKPDKQYPKDQIDQIDKILAQQERDKDQQRKQEKAYNEAVEKGDAMFSMEEYEQSKQAYNKALSVKPEEAYPQKRIDKINDILAKQEEDRKAYEQAIESGDRLFDSEEYEQAKSAYQKATEIRPDASYPNKQIDEIDDILDRQMAQKKKQEARDKKYENAINTADQLLRAEEYEDARTAYDQALEVKPEEEYPKSKIDEIDRILEEQQQEKERAYERAVAKADNLMDEEKYEKAGENYRDALGIKPNEDYPENQIQEIERILAQLERERKEKERKDRLYTEEVEKADDYYKSNKLYNAKVHYRKALEYKPDEQHPKNRLKSIERRLENMETADKSDNKKSGKEDKEKKPEKDEPEKLDFGSNEEKEEFLNELAKKYPEGITVENYDLENKEIKRVIVNYDGVAKDYRKVKHSWGRTFYFRNGQDISKEVFRIETQERD